MMGYCSWRLTGVIFVCCTFTPLFHITTIKIKKVFGIKSLWRVYREKSFSCTGRSSRRILNIFCKLKRKLPFHQLCLLSFFLTYYMILAAAERVDRNTSSTSRLPVVVVQGRQSRDAPRSGRFLLRGAADATLTPFLQHPATLLVSSSSQGAGVCSPRSPKMRKLTLGLRCVSAGKGLRSPIATSAFTGMFPSACDRVLSRGGFTSLITPPRLLSFFAAVAQTHLECPKCSNFCFLFFWTLR